MQVLEGSNAHLGSPQWRRTPQAVSNLMEWLTPWGHWAGLRPGCSILRGRPATTYNTGPRISLGLAQLGTLGGTASPGSPQSSHVISVTPEKVA